MEKRPFCVAVVLCFPSAHVFAQGRADTIVGWTILLTALLTALAILGLALRTKTIIRQVLSDKQNTSAQDYEKYLTNLNVAEIDVLLHALAASETKDRQSQALVADTPNSGVPLVAALLSIISLASLPFPLTAQAQQQTNKNLLQQEGILITLALIMIPVLIGIIILVIKLRSALQNVQIHRTQAQARELAEFIKQNSASQSVSHLLARKHALEFTLTHHELGGEAAPSDAKGLVGNVQLKTALPFVARKKNAAQRPRINTELARVIIWFLGSGAFWLVFGTTVGEYLGIKFVAPDVDQWSWSVPVHKPALAFHRFYRSPFTFDHVRNHLVSAVGGHLCSGAAAIRPGAAADYGRRSFLAGANRTAVLHRSIDVRQHLARIDVDGRQAIYRQCGADGPVLALAGNRRKPDVALAFVLRV